MNSKATEIIERIEKLQKESAETLSQLKVSSIGGPIIMFRVSLSFRVILNYASGFRKNIKIII